MNPTTQKPFRILFLCTGNSARSIFGEYLIRKIGTERFISFSAGAKPKDEVNPYAIRVLQDYYDIDATSARSKSWEEFLQAELDFVITVCDSARENCPIFPGRPITAHWRFPDLASFEGDDTATYNHFAEVALQMKRRVELLCCLPFEQLDHLRLEQMTREIGLQ